MNTEVKRFFNFFLPCISPFVLLLASYFILDPFCVVHAYKNPFNETMHLKNMDFISTEAYRNNREEKKYDSFIFGSSRSQVFKCTEWKKYLGAAEPFHFASDLESVPGIYGKIKYIHSLGDTIKNALILLDETSFSDTQSGFLLIKHPLTSENSYFDFHIEFIKTYFKELFFLKYIYYRIFGKTMPHTTPIIADQPVTYNTTTNDVSFKWYDDQIAADSIHYYQKPVFYKRSEVKRYGKEMINVKYISELEFVVRILKKDHANYKIIISPLYDQQIFNRTDLIKLQIIFGKENVYDFSGINELTIPIYNYYERSHFRPQVANAIMKIIYQK